MPLLDPAWLRSLNALAGGLFLLATLGMVATRQVQGCLRLFVTQSVLLAVSAFLLSGLQRSPHTFALGVLDLVTKPVILPWLLRRALPGELYARREVTQALNIPTSLLIALALTVAGYLWSAPLLGAGGGESVGLNLPIGLAGLLIGGFTAAIRREAVPLFLGLLAMENAAFFAGIAIAPELPLIVEATIAFDVLVLVFVVGILTRTVHHHIGTTEVGELTSLAERPPR